MVDYFIEWSEALTASHAGGRERGGLWLSHPSVLVGIGMIAGFSSSLTIVS